MTSDIQSDDIGLSSELCRVLQQEDPELKAILGNLARPHLKIDLKGAGDVAQPHSPSLASLFSMIKFKTRGRGCRPMFVGRAF